MTMKFQDIRDAVITLLGTYAGSDFRVLGYQDPSKAAETVLDESRLVEAYFKRGEFPKSGGALNGPFDHEITINLDLTVGKASEGDLAILDNPSADPEDIKTALADYKEAKQLADRSLDELFDKVWIILMAANHMDLGMSEKVSSRWIPDMEKDDPVRLGQYIILTGSTRLTCRVQEESTGVIPVPGEKFEGEIRVEDNTNEGRAGILVDNATP